MEETYIQAEPGWRIIEPSDLSGTPVVGWCMRYNQTWPVTPKGVQFKECRLRYRGNESFWEG
jgi:hypothetical protein